MGTVIPRLESEGIKVKIDKSKFKSKTFWAAILSLVGILLIQTGTVTFDNETYQGAITAILTALTALGILVDGPVTSGSGESTENESGEQ